MKNWIPFAEGEYVVEQALLVAADYSAVVVENAIVEIYSDQRGIRYLNGRGRVLNTLIVDLLDDNDELDLLLDFGGEFKYLLKEPNLQGGKVFSPEVKSVLRFTPQNPWQHMPPTEFEKFASRLRILSERE